MTQSRGYRWKQDGQAIRWDLMEEKQLPHEDHLEMSGKFVSQYIHYHVDSSRQVRVSQILVWPWLRMLPNDTHASMKTEQEKGMVDPVWTVDGGEVPVYGREVLFDGCLHIRESDGALLFVERSFFPPMEQKAACMRLRAVNISGKTQCVEPHTVRCSGSRRGTRGIYLYDSLLQPESARFLEPGEAAVWYVLFGAAPVLDGICWPEGETLYRERAAFLQTVEDTVRVETPDPILNQAFFFAKIRGMESIFQTRSGLLHSPGGLHYYAAVWANDQAEYANPFFAWTGLPAPLESVKNCLRLFQRFMGPDYEPIPSSVIAEGDSIWEGKGDRGDAAMYAYGTSRVLLTLGDRSLCDTFFPAVEWCLEYCRRKKLPEGVIASDSDELEGRFPAGIANLATSCLVYDALYSAAVLSRELGRMDQAENYRRWRKELGEAIEAYFGCRIDGHETYRYCREDERLRSWMCIPLVMDLFTRREGVLDALFSPKLWTENGLLTMEGDHTFWDRSTVYALRGVFAAGEADRGLPYLLEYSGERLLGEHVPYAVEAWPEGDQRHLSAESALYCRVCLEGILGLRPTGLRSFRVRPSLPSSWNRICVKRIFLAGTYLDIFIERAGSGNYRMTIQTENGEEKICSCTDGAEVNIELAR